jgi:hypothetical protein
MNKKRFELNVLKISPELGVSCGYFFFRPVGHIISGFLMEFTPTYRYIWKYSLPLFEPWNFLNLSFAERLSKVGFESKIKMDEIEMAKYFSSSIRPYTTEMKKLENVSEFLSYYKDSEFRSNCNTFRAMAIANIIDGNKTKAKQYLSEIVTDCKLRASDSFLTETKILLSEIEKNNVSIPSMVLSWEQDTKRRFAIE